MKPSIDSCKNKILFGVSFLYSDDCDVSVKFETNIFEAMDWVISILSIIISLVLATIYRRFHYINPIGSDHQIAIRQWAELSGQGLLALVSAS